MTIINDFALFFTTDYIPAYVSNIKGIFAIDLIWCPDCVGEEL